MSPAPASDFIEEGFIEEHFFEGPAGGFPSSRRRHPAVGRVPRVAFVHPVRRAAAVEAVPRVAVVMHSPL